MCTYSFYLYQNASRRGLAGDELARPVFGFVHPSQLTGGRLWRVGLELRIEQLVTLLRPVTTTALLAMRLVLATTTASSSSSTALSWPSLALALLLLFVALTLTLLTLLSIGAEDDTGEYKLDKAVD